MLAAAVRATVLLDEITLIYAVSDREALLGLVMTPISAQLFL